MPYIQEQNEIREDYKILKKTSATVLVWRRRDTRGVLFLVLFAVVVPLLCYFFLFNTTHLEIATDTCSIKPSYRIQCGNPNATFDYCHNINCCFDNATKLCFHHIPSRYQYRSSDNGYQSALKKSPFQKALVPTIDLKIQEIDENNVRIILHDDKNQPEATPEVNNKNYNVSVNQSPLFVEIFRKEPEELIFSTEIGPLIASEKYWEWAFQLSGEYLFGLGEMLLNVEENSTLTKVVYGNSEDHSTLPMFMAFKNETYHGLIVRHDGPLEVTILSSNLIILKSLAGGKIIVDVSVGPSLKELIGQMSRDKNLENLGMDVLGVHLCREGGTPDLKAIVKQFVQEKSANVTFNIPYISDCFHENLALGLMDPALRTSTLTDVVTSIRTYIIEQGIEFPIALIPHVLLDSNLYQDTKATDVFYKNESEVYSGLFGSRAVVYPNFNHPNISQFMDPWIHFLKRSLAELWKPNFVLSKNWPSDEAKHDMNITGFQYLSEPLIEALTLTLPWNVKSQRNSHFWDHNAYGMNQLEVIQAKEPESKIMVVSHTVDTNHPLIVQNMDITWSNFQKSIKTLLFNSLFGFQLTAIPVCGSTSNFDISKHESLCLRWYLMSATAPVFRISSDKPYRDPNSLTSLSKYLANQANRALILRRSLSYYMLTTMIGNEPLMRPLMYEFSHDARTFNLVDQYMVGAGLMISHPTLSAQSVLRIYFPEVDEAWFDYGGGVSYNHKSGDEGVVAFYVVETDWVAFVRGGHIIPIINEEDVGEVLILKVGLKGNDNNCLAEGHIKLADWDYKFTSDDQSLKIDITAGNQDIQEFVLKEVQVFKEGKNGAFLKLQNYLNLKDLTSCSYDIPGNSINCV